MEAMVQPGEVRVRRAVLSVSDKTGIVEFARGLAELGIELVSTGGTAAVLRDSGLEVRPIEQFTGFPEIMGGRVKTLHPKLYAGLLALRDDEEHMAAAAEHEIELVDLVCVNLYPFEATAARRGATEHEVIEQIDIGGPTMIRASAKNFAFTAVVVNPASYDAIVQELRDLEGRLSLGTRESLATEAFSYTASYDSAISRWFVEKHDDFPPLLLSAYEKVTDLSYGENPHQRAAYYAQAGTRMHALSMVRQLGGKDLSFNNVLDLNAGRMLVGEFELPACAIIKHNNPCGVAVGGSVLEAYHAAFACDPLSAFGGVVCVNGQVDRGFAEALTKQFCEVLIAPAYTDEALALLATKPNMRILQDGERRRVNVAERDIKRVMGGLADPGSRHRARGPHGDGGRHRAQAVRGGVGRDAVRLEGLQARALERDRLVERPRLGGHRRGPDEPRGLGPAGDREGARRRLLAGRLGDGVRRVLPLPGRAAARDRRRRHHDHPAGRLGARPGGGRGGRRGGDQHGVHPQAALPALMPSPEEMAAKVEQRTGRRISEWLELVP